MKKIILMPILLLSITMLPIYTLNEVVAATQPTPGEQCSTPTQFITITAGPGIKYDKDKLEVDRATCVQITLINKDSAIHDFTIDIVAGDEGIASVYIYVDLGETGTFNVTTPDIDKTFTFYCWQPGHRAAGMEGKFIVGKGSSEDDAPSFGFWITFVTFMSTGVIISRKRR